MFLKERHKIVKTDKVINVKGHYLNDETIRISVPLITLAIYVNPNLGFLAKHAILAVCIRENENCTISKGKNIIFFQFNLFRKFLLIYFLIDIKKYIFINCFLIIIASFLISQNFSIIKFLKFIIIYYNIFWLTTKLFRNKLLPLLTNEEIII